MSGSTSSAWTPSASTSGRSPTTRSEQLAEVPGLTVFGPPRGPDRLGPVSFEIEGIHAHDVSEILDRHGVAVRAGHHCAQVLMDRLGSPPPPAPASAPTRRPRRSTASSTASKTPAGSSAY